MTRGENYPNAPIALVVAEIRHPAIGEITGAELSNFKESFADTLPVMRWEEGFDFDLPSGDRRPFRFPRFVSRDLHRSVTLQPDAVIVETMGYTGWQDFRLLIESALQAHDRIKPLEGLDRVGLRYIDEIRVTDTQDVTNWSEWVSTDLVGPKSIEHVLDATIARSQSTAVVQVNQNISYTVRYGASNGQAVVSTNNLVRKAEDSGDYFLLDLDGGWVPERRSVPEFQVHSAMEILDDLHHPIGALFESLITDKLRDEVLR